MSDLIRAVRAAWLPLPTEALDVRSKSPRDNYRLAQIEAESEQRMQQRQIDRQIRRGNQASPALSDSVRSPIPSVPPSILAFTIPLK